MLEILITVERNAFHKTLPHSHSCLISRINQVLAHDVQLEPHDTKPYAKQQCLNLCRPDQMFSGMNNQKLPKQMMITDIAGRQHNTFESIVYLSTTW